MNKKRKLKENIDSSYDIWENVLQLPMQPLSENLSDDLYESFESCPVKYISYKEAARLAIEDLAEKRKGDIILYVLGAGRGGIVNKLVELVNELETSNKIDSEVTIYALDKNPVSLDSLRRLSKEKWNLKRNIVEVIEGDMRKFQPSRKCHIIVSELLGSFADNELSPECLVGLENIYGEDPDNVIMIPQKYTSFVNPANLPFITKEARKGINRCFVCKIKGERRIGKPQKCFTFHHPKTKIEECYSSTEFHMTEGRETLNCIIGYFECNLYGNIGFSTNPDPSDGDLPFSKNMISWHPFLFVLDEDLQCRKGDIVEIEIWRKFNENKVWYEWKVTVWLPNKAYIRIDTKIHNRDGKNDWMDLKYEDETPN